MSRKTLIPLFPYMSLAATLKISRHLVELGVHVATREAKPARYLIYQDRALAHAEYQGPMLQKPTHHHNGEVQHDDPARFRVWGRSFLSGWCSADELDGWKAGKGNVAIRCSVVKLDGWLDNAANNRHVIHRPPSSPAVPPLPPLQELEQLADQATRERAALKCGCGRSYTWAEYLALEKPINCAIDDVSDQVEGADENGHPIACWFRDCACKNTMCRPKPEGA